MLTLAQYVLTAALLAGLLGVSQPAPEVEVPPVEVAFDGQRAYELVRELVEEHPNRVTGTPEDEAAAAWVADRFRALGLEVVEQRFEVWGSFDGTAERSGRFAGVNVLGVRPGELEQAIVIGAHRDIVPETVQGAVDNASGTGTVLELARVLLAEPRRYTYVFASWGAEEVGLGGSRYYVGTPLRPTALALSLDVTGYADWEELLLPDWPSLPMEPALLVDHLAVGQGLTSRPQQRGLVDLAGLPLTTPGATDSLPFALQGIPALGIGWQTPPGLIHSPRDTLDRLDAESLELAGRLAERLVRVAELQGPQWLAGPAWYLRSADGSVVPPRQVSLAALVLLLFALATPALAARQAARAGHSLLPRLGAQVSLLAGSLLAAGVAVGAPWLLGLWREPDFALFLVWMGLLALGLVPIAAVARQMFPQPPALRRLALGGTLAFGFVVAAVAGNLFLAALLLAYPLVVLPRLTFRPGWWRALDAALVLPWVALALGLLLLSQAYASFAPEYLPALRLSLFQAAVALLLYLGVGLSLAPRQHG